MNKVEQSAGTGLANPPMTIAQALGKLSEMELEAYIYIAEYWKKTSGSFPPFDEISDHLGVAKSVGYYYVERLVDIGLVDKYNRSGKRTGIYVLAGASLSIDQSTVIYPNDRAFRRPRHRGGNKSNNHANL